MPEPKSLSCLRAQLAAGEFEFSQHALRRLVERNISEQEIRDPVTLCKISGGTRGEDGRRCRDTFLSLKKTCQKNAISFWAYLGDRLGIAANTVARLPDLIRRRAAPAPA